MTKSFQAPKHLFRGEKNWESKSFQVFGYNSYDDCVARVLNGGNGNIAREKKAVGKSCVLLTGFPSSDTRQCVKIKYLFIHIKR